MFLKLHTKNTETKKFSSALLNMDGVETVQSPEGHLEHKENHEGVGAILLSKAGNGAYLVKETLEEIEAMLDWRIRIDKANEAPIAAASIITMSAAELVDELRDPETSEERRSVIGKALEAKYDEAKAAEATTTGDNKDV